MHKERSHKAYEIYISGFCKKDLVEGEWAIVGTKMMCPQNSGSALQDLFIILNNETGEEAHENKVMVFLKTFYLTFYLYWQTSVKKALASFLTVWFYCFFRLYR